MPTQEIPRDEWPVFFDNFSDLHDGWPVTLEVFSPDIGAQEAAHELALEGIITESKNGDYKTIEINLGNNPEDHVSHTIEGPTLVWLEQSNEGDDAALEIESSDGAKTLLRLHSKQEA